MVGNSQARVASGIGPFGTNTWIEQQMWAVIAFIVLAATVATPVLQQAVSDLSESLDDALSSEAGSSSQSVAPGEVPEGLTAQEWADIQNQIAALQATPTIDPQVTVEPVVTPTQRAGYRGEASYTTAGVTFSFDDRTVRLSTVSVGGPIAAAAPAEVADRVVYDRGTVEEWFVETDRGVEQGWTIAEAPAGVTDELVIEVAATTDLIPVPIDDETIHFLDLDGNVMAQYAGLLAWDADGADLPAAMTYVGDRIEITVDVAGAAYPITVDPTFTQDQTLNPVGNTAEDRHGTAIASTASVAVVATPGSDLFGVDIGAVHVYRNTSGTWALNGQLRPNPADSPTANDGYGTAVAVSGDTIAVGAPFKSTAGANGVVYTYTYDGANWLFGDTLYECDALSVPCGGAADPSTTSAGFGSALAMDINSETELVIGSAFSTNNGSNGGTVYIYRDGGSGFRLTDANDVIVNQVGNGSDRFGEALDVFGGNIAIGAPGTNVGAGAVYWATFNDASGLTGIDGLTASGVAANDNLGLDVAVGVDPDGDVLIGSAGGNTASKYRFWYVDSGVAPGADLETEIATLSLNSLSPQDGTPSVDIVKGSAEFMAIGLPIVNSGSEVRLFEWDDVNDTALQVAQKAATTSGSQWGSALAFAGGSGDIWAGEPARSQLSGQRTAADAGRVELFERNSPSNVTYEAFPGATPVDAQLGASIAIDGDVMVVGAPGDEGAGSAYIYTRTNSASPWTLDDIVIQPAAEADQGDDFGATVAVRNGIVAVGAPANGDASDGSGRVYVYEGPGTWGLRGSLIDVPGTAQDGFGFSLAFGADEDELLIGAPIADTIYRATYDSPIVGDWQAGGYVNAGGADIDFGYALDTYVDGGTLLFAVGAPNDVRGLVRVFSRPVGSPFAISQDASILGQFSGDQLGLDVEIIPDLVAARGDAGLIEVHEGPAWTGTPVATSSLVGSPDLELSTSRLALASPATEEVEIYDLPLSGVLNTPDDTLTPTGVLGSSAPASVAFDGANQVAFGLSGEDTNGLDSGIVFVAEVVSTVIGEPNVDIDGEWAVVGDPATDSALIYERVSGAWVARGGVAGTPGTSFGADVSIDGRVLLVGAPGDDTLGQDAGRVFQFFRSGNDDTFGPVGFIDGNQGTGALFGSQVDMVRNDVIIGSPGVLRIEVFSFTGGEASLATLQQTLNGNDIGFGGSIATTSTIPTGGEIFVAGIPGALSDTGGVEVYTKSGGTYSFAEFAPLPAGAQVGDEWGISVDTANLAFNRLAIVFGANGAEEAAYALIDLNSSFEFGALLTEPAIGFGRAVSISGDSIVIASDSDIFRYTASHDGVDEVTGGTLFTPDPPITDVAIEGRLAIAVPGAPFYDLFSEGAVGNIPSITGNDSAGDKLFNPFASDQDRFGTTVTTDGNTVIVSAPNAERRATDATGRVFVFRSIPAGNFILTQELLPPASIAASPIWGTDIAIDGNTVAISNNSGQVAWATRTDELSLFGAFATAGGTVGGTIALEGDLLASVTTGGTISLFTGGPAGWAAGPTDTLVRPGANLRDLAIDQGIVYYGESDNGVGADGTVIAVPVTSGFETDSLSTIQGDRQGSSSDQYGATIDADNGQLIVGAPFDDNGGQVYLYDCSWDGVNPVACGQTALFDNGGLQTGEFGRRVAIHGDYAIASARQSGRAVFSSDSILLNRGSDGTWYRTTQLFDAPDADAIDQFSAVAIGENWVVIGGGLEDQFGADAGAAFAFAIPDQSEIILPLSGNGQTAPVTNSGFGRAVALDGNTLVVGAPFTDNGTAYVFDRNPAGVWQFTQELTAAWGVGAQAGTSVAIDDGVIVVGGPAHNGANNGGIAIYDLIGSTWTQNGAILTSGDPNGGGDLGRSIHLEGDTIVVGQPARRAETSANGVPAGSNNAGGLAVFERNLGSWSWTTDLTRDPLVANEFIGWDVDLENDTFFSVSLPGSSSVVDVWDINGHDETIGGFGTAQLPSIDVSGDANLIAVVGRSEPGFVVDRANLNTVTPLDPTAATLTPSIDNDVVFDGTRLIASRAAAGVAEVIEYEFSGGSWVVASDRVPAASSADSGRIALFGDTLIVAVPNENNARGFGGGSLYAVDVALPSFDDPQLSFNLGLGIGETGTVSVASSLSLAAIDAALIEAATEDNSTLVSANLGQTEIQNSPLSSLEFGQTPIPAAILGNPDLAAIPLIDIDINEPGGWTAILAGTALAQRPLQDVTLGEVLAYNQASGETQDPAGAVASLPLSSLDVNGTPLSSLPLSSLALGTLPLSSLDAAFNDLGVDLCLELLPFLQPEIATCGELGQLSLTEASLRGAPLSSLPLSSLPLSSLDVTASPLSSLPLSSLDLSASPLSSLPLSSLDLSDNPTETDDLGEIVVDTEPGTALVQAPLSSLPLSSLPLSSLPLSSLPLSSLEVNGVSLDTLPLSSLPLSSLPLSSLPLSSLPLSSLPLSSLDVNGAPLSSLPLSSLPLSSLVLSDTPLSSLSPTTLNPNFCEEVEAAVGDAYTCPEVEDLTVYEATLVGIPLSSLPLSSLPLSSLSLGTTPLSSLPLSSLPLSSLPLSSLPLSSLELAGTPLSSLPLSSLGPVAAPLSSLPLSSLDVAGTPLSSLPLSSLPLSSLPLSSLPLSSLPLSSLPLSSLSVGAAPLSSLPLSSLPLSSLDVVDSPLSSLPLSSLPLSSLTTSSAPLSSLVDCNLVDCDVDTLGDAFLAGAFDPSQVTLADVAIYTADIRIGDLIGALLTLSAEDIENQIAGTNATLGQLLDIGDLTLGDLPLDDPIVANLTLGQLEGALWIVSYADLLGAVIDPATNQPFSDADVQAALDAAIALVGATIADLEYWGDTTLGDLLIGTGGNAILDAITLENLGPWVGFLDIQTLISEAGAVGPLDPITELLSELTPAELGTLTLGDLINLFGLSQVGEWLTALEAQGALDGFTLADLLAALVGLEDVAFGGVDFTDVETGALPENTVPPVTFRAGFQVTDTVFDKAITVAVDLPATATYIPGTARINDGNGFTPLEPTITDNTAEWQVFGVSPDTQYLIEFDVLPEVSLGSTSLNGTGRIVGTDVAVFGDTSVTVGEGLEPNDTIDDATIVTADTVYLTYISSTNDRDVFQVDVSERDRLAIQLSNLTADLDLVIYADPTDSSVGSSLTGVSDQAPLIPITDPDGTAVSIEVPANVPRIDQFDSRVTLLDFAATSGTEDELIVTEPLAAGTYYIQVHGADGARNQDPATLQIQTLAADARPDCSTLVDVRGGVALPNATPGVAPAPTATGNTVFLVNEMRLEQLYGPLGRADVMNSLEALVLYLEANPSLGLDPLVVPVDGYQNVVDAYAAWDDPADPEDACDPEVANAVVGEIILSAVNPFRDQIDHLIVVGGDDIIPMARLKDATSVANEYDYRTEFSNDLNGTDPGNVSSLGATFWESRYLSDDPYAESQARSLGDRFLYVPDFALGRLVETPSEIASALDHFVFFDGTLDMNTAAVLGYDFLTDQTADQVQTLNEAGLTVDDDFADGVDDDGGPTGGPDGPWDRQDAVEVLVPLNGDPAPDLIAFNAHFDHYRALPAAGDKIPGFDDNVETSAILAAIPDQLKGSVIFSAGCHSGLSVSDIQIGATNLDWAQTAAQTGALYVGNTGFGYGDTEVIAYTERLMTIFTDEVVTPLQLPGAFAPTTIGQAWSTAKNRFVAETTNISVYDEKAVMQATFYGLPFYRVDLAPEAAPPVPDNETTPDQTGSEALVVPIDANFDSELSGVPVSTGIGNYYPNINADGAEDVISVPGRPVQPKTSVDVSVVDPNDPESLALIARGGLIIDMTSDYVPEDDPVITAVVVDEAVDVEEPPVPNVAFPQNPIQITTTNTAVGERQTLSIATGQYKPGPQIQRLDDDISVVVYYADATNTDFNAPRIRDIDTSVDANGLLTVTLRANDDNPTDGVDRVYVLLAQNPGVGATDVDWDGFDLTQVGTGNTWAGSIQLDGGTTGIELLVQAKDGAGNVSYATDKGGQFVQPEPEPVLPDPVDLDVVVDNTNLDPSGVYTAPVAITVTAEGGEASFSIDGEPAQPVPFPPGSDSAVINFGIDGEHQIVITTPQGETSVVDLQLDTQGQAPAIDIAFPVDGGVYEPSDLLLFNFTCSDPSLETCVGLLDGAAVDSGEAMPTQPDDYVLTVTATDKLGTPTPPRTVNFTIAKPVVVDVDDTNQDPVSTWFDGAAQITVTSNFAIDVLVNGVAQSVTSGAAFSVATPGVNTVEIESGSFSETLTIRVDDDGAPDVTPVFPTPGQVVAAGGPGTFDWNCADVSPFGCTGQIAGETVSIGDALPEPGSYVLQITGTDILGQSATVPVPFTVDLALGVAVDQTNASPTGSDWFTGPVEITVVGGGRGPITYEVDGPPALPIENGESFTITGDGVHTYEVADDVDTISGTIRIDSNGGPNVTVTTPAPNTSYAIDAGVEFDFSCTDISPTTCEGLLLGTNTPVTDGSLLPTTPGTYTLQVIGTDAVGDTTAEIVVFSMIESLDVQIDQSNQQPSGWYSAPVEITATAASPVTYSINGGPAQPVGPSNTFVVPGDGDVDVVVSAGAGQSETLPTLQIDSNGPPVISSTVPAVGAAYPAGSVLFYDFDCADVSPTTCSATLDGVPVSLGDALPTTGGSYELIITGTDSVNDSDTLTVPFTVTVDLDVEIDDSNLTNGWYDTSVDITVNGTGSLSYSIGSGPSVPLFDGETFTVTGDGIVDVIITDGVDTADLDLQIDGDGAPVFTPVVPVAGGVYAFDGLFTYDFTCTDTSLVSCVVDVDGVPVADGDPLPSTEGTYTVTVNAIDEVGNTFTDTFTFDVTLSLEVDIDDTFLAANGSGWYTGPVEITVDAASAITFSLDGGATTTPITGGSSFTVNAEGATMVQIATAGGEVFDVTIEIDATGPPVFTPVTPTDGEIFADDGGEIFAWLCSDTSTATCEGSVGGNPVNRGEALPTTPGVYTLEIAASDTVGNTATYTVDFEIVELLDVAIDQTNFDAVAGWYSAPVDITVNGSRPLSYSIDGGPSVPLVDGETFTVPGDGIFDVSITDGVDTVDIDDLSIDATPGPVFTEGTPASGAVIPSDHTLTYAWVCEDVSPFTCEGEVAGAPVSIGDSLPTTPGAYTLSVTATDVFGTAVVYDVDFTIIEALVVDVDAANLAANGSGWYTGDVEITVTGGAAISYTLDGVGPTPILDGESFTVTGEGLHTYVVETDAGETVSGTVEIDSIDPTFTEISPTALTQYPAGSGDTYDWLCEDDNLVTCEGTVNGVPVSIGGDFPTAPGGYTLTVTGVDVAGNDTVSNVYFEIVVVGVSEPEIVTINGPAVPIGDAVVLDIAFGDDDGAADVYTIDVDWGDSDDDDPSTLPTTCTASTGAPTTGNPACEIVSAPTAPGETDGAMTATFSYPEAGVYTVTVTVTDAAGNTDTSLFEFAVVYDPSINGRVAGAGWYWSGPEAYAEEEPWGGPAFFGYRARYKNDESLKGKTRLHLLGEFFFKSTSYDYLIINDTMAIAEGVGKINGDTGYRFRVQGIDNGRFDFFQISIWDEVTGEVIYDNGILYDEGDLVLLGGIRVKE